MIVLRYPVSLNVIRKLKTGDVVYYTGKIVVMDRSVVDVLENTKDTKEQSSTI